MIFRFLLLSDEIDDFKREIQIDGDAYFLELHKTIIESVNFKDNEICSFFICDDNWEKEQEITLVEMNTGSDEDSYIMESTKLSDFLEEEKQKLLYVFDFLTERAFFMELREIIPGKNLDKAVCSKSTGEAPQQFVDIETFDTNTGLADLGEIFYGDEGYDLNELDASGFDGIDDIPAAEDEF